MPMKGPCLRGDEAWMKRATTSFPVPDSPCRHVVTSVAATRAARSRTWHHAFDVPTIGIGDRGSRIVLKLFANTVALMTAPIAHPTPVVRWPYHTLPASSSAHEFV